MEGGIKVQLVSNSEVERMEMAESDDREDRREGLPDRRERPPKFEFTFEHFKWIASIAIALMGIYVLSERRAATNDLSAAYLDKKVSEMTQQMDKRFTEMQNGIVSMQTDLKGVALTNSTIQGDVKALGDRTTKLENAVTVQQQAYNFNFTSRLAAAEARLGIKPPTKE